MLQNRVAKRAADRKHCIGSPSITHRCRLQTRPASTVHRGHACPETALQMSQDTTSSCCAAHLGNHTWARCRSPARRCSRWSNRCRGAATPPIVPRRGRWVHRATLGRAHWPDEPLSTGRRPHPAPLWTTGLRVQAGIVRSGSMTPRPQSWRHAPKWTQRACAPTPANQQVPRMPLVATQASATRQPLQGGSYSQLSSIRWDSDVTGFSQAQHAQRRHGHCKQKIVRRSHLRQACRGCRPRDCAASEVRASRRASAAATPGGMHGCAQSSTERAQAAIVQRAAGARVSNLQQAGAKLVCAGPAARGTQCQTPGAYRSDLLHQMFRIDSSIWRPKRLTHASRYHTATVESLEKTVDRERVSSWNRLVTEHSLLAELFSAWVRPRTLPCSGCFVKHCLAYELPQLLWISINSLPCWEPVKVLARRLRNSCCSCEPPPD